MDKLTEILHKNNKLYNTRVNSRKQRKTHKNNKQHTKNNKHSKHSKYTNVAINNILSQKQKNKKQQYQPELFSIININKNNKNNNSYKLHNLLDNTSVNLYKTRSNLPARLISLGKIETDEDEDIYNNKIEKYAIK